mgnify:CR=1 FL=1
MLHNESLVHAFNKLICVGSLKPSLAYFGFITNFVPYFYPSPITLTHNVISRLETT